MHKRAISGQKEKKEKGRVESSDGLESQSPHLLPCMSTICKIDIPKAATYVLLLHSGSFDESYNTYYLAILTT